MKTVHVFAFASIINLGGWAAREAASAPPRATAERIPDEVKEVLAGFEKQRELDNKRRKATIADLKSGKSLPPNKEPEALRRAEEFYAKHPELRAGEPSNHGVPAGQANELRREVDRARAEAAEASSRAAQRQAKAEIKRLEAEGRRLANQMFVPTYTDEEINELAALGPLSDIPSQPSDERIGLRSVGLYVSTFRVKRILNDNAAIVSAPGKNGKTEGEELCLRAPTKDLRADMDISFATTLHYLPGIERVSYATSNNTVVEDRPLVVITHYAGRVDDLLDAWKLLRRKKR